MPNGRYILAEGPQEHTLSDYYSGCLHNGVSVFVTVAMPSEWSGYKKMWCEKCLAFWDRAEVVTKDGWVITRDETAEKIISSATGERSVGRAFTAKRTVPGGPEEVRPLVHIHQENWPDHGVPNRRILQDTIKETLSCRRALGGNVAVNCSAGIGRAPNFRSCYGSNA